MASFITDDFLLYDKYAQELYHDYAKECPIIDYHNHLSPQEIAQDKQYRSITEIWLHGDHYKWRAMRACGIDERLITGAASDEEKFAAYAKCVPLLIRNPLYHWTHLELQRYFGIDELLHEGNAAAIYDSCGAQLATSSYSAQSLLDRMNVKVVCTTDDPIDPLTYHTAYSIQASDLKMLPTFRPDRYITIQSATFLDAVRDLGVSQDVDIRDFGMLVDALMTRIEYFDERGCKLSDHGLSHLPLGHFSRKSADKAFAAALRGEVLDESRAQDFMFTLMQLLCREYARRGWVQQFHLGALRNNNKRMLSTLGPDTGWDSIGDFDQGTRLSHFLDSLDTTGSLAKTILYNLNPADNALMAAMIGNFNDGSIAGKIQYGSGWWFLDQLDGMRAQINTLSNMGVLSQFIGMLTDSRSMLSFPRHEYFRRLLCSMLGEDVSRGLLPADMSHIGGIVKAICYDNAERYFDF